jgi:acyl-CoA thioester hydrolase
MDGFRFSTEVRVRFAETDAQGVVHNSNYLVWFEIARIAYLEEYAGGYPALRETGLESFVLESHVRYRLPAHFDDRLQIHARIGEVRGARFRFDYSVSRNGEVIADGWTSHAVVDAGTLRPTRIPQALADAISRAESSSAASSASS